MGVELTVFGDERALRTGGMEGETVRGALILDGEVMSEKLEGLENPSVVLDFLVGELKIEGSTFSESSSSKMAGARRLPVDCVWVGFKGEAKAEWDEMAANDALSGTRDLKGRALTVLPVLRALQGLQSRSTKFGEGLARKEGHVGGTGRGPGGK